MKVKILLFWHADFFRG